MDFMIFFSKNHYLGGKNAVRCQPRTLPAKHYQQANLNTPNMKIKIAFVTPEYPHPKTPGICGGIGTSIMNLALEMSNKISNVSILVYGQEEDEVFEENGITFYRIKNSTRKKLPWYFTQKKIERLLKNLVKEGKVNIVEAADWTGITAFIKLKCPIVVKLHGSESYFSHFSKLPVKWRIRYAEKRALRNASALVSVSQYTAKTTKAIMSLKRDFAVIPNGIDIENFEAASENTAAPIILYFGTLVRKKGSLELPLIFNKVFERNIDAKLVLVGLDSNDPTTGNSSVWQMMRELFTHEALKNVSYAGSVAYSEIKKYISDATVCLFPSFAEALPVSWIEAMAMEKAVIASNIGWAKELIEDGKEGFLVHPKDHEEFADKILSLLLNKEKRSKFGIAAREKATTRFSIQVVAEQYIQFYNTVISK